MSIPNTPMWSEFFSHLRELPELWKVKSDEFKDRNKKRVAMQKLMEYYKQIEADANIDTLKKRLANIKTCYRRELKKVERSVRSGAGAEDEYVPSLWYYDLLDFLRDQESQVVGVSTIDLELVEEDELQVEQEGSESLPGTSTPQSSSKRKKTSVADQMRHRNDILKGALEQLAKKDSNNKDEASVFAESWATSFRKLPGTQQIYAKKAIEEILVLGQLNLLTLNAVSIHHPDNDLHASSFRAPSQSSGTSMSSTPNYTPNYTQPRFPESRGPVVIMSGNTEGLYSNVQQLLTDSDYS